MLKEIRLIKSLVWTVFDKASTESESHSAQIAIVKQCRKLMTKAGFEVMDVTNMHVCGRMRVLFEEKTISLTKRREDEMLERLTKTLDFHKIPYQTYDFGLGIMVAID